MVMLASRRNREIVEVQNLRDGRIFAFLPISALLDKVRLLDDDFYRIRSIAGAVGEHPPMEETACQREIHELKY